MQIALCVLSFLWIWATRCIHRASYRSLPWSLPMRAVAQVGVRVSFPIKWLAGQAYHRSCRGCPATCGVTPNMAASSRGGFVSPWHARTHTPATPHPPPIFCTQTESLTFENISHSSTQACICNHTYLSQTIQSSRVTGVMQRLMYRSRGSKRKNKRQRGWKKVCQWKHLPQELKALSFLFIEYRWCSRASQTFRFFQMSLAMMRLILYYFGGWVGGGGVSLYDTGKKQHVCTVRSAFISPVAKLIFFS